MSEQGKRRSTRKTKPKEHIIPITIEDNIDNENIITSSSSDTPAEGIPRMPTEDTICDSVQQLSLKTNKTSERIQNRLPSVNVPENIIIVYDCVTEEDGPKFELNGNYFGANDAVLRCLRMFLLNKHMMEKKHKFALVALRKNGAQWMKDFTANVQQVITELNNLQNTEAEDISDAYLNLDVLFVLIKSKIKMPISEDLYTIPPQCVVRVVFVYTRSNSMPILSNEEIKRDVIDCPYFNFDVLFVHKDPDSESNSRAVFEKLSEIDSKGTSYCISVGSSYSDLQIGMAKLLGHPLQRPRQGDEDYRINC